MEMKVQLTFEQHGFEIIGSTYMWVPLNMDCFQ